MFLLYRLRLFLFFFGSSSFPIDAMDISNHCDFKIINGYGKELQCQLTFEYKAESASYGESGILILEDGHQRPILLSQLKILDSDTNSIIPFEKLNIAQIIIEAWVPGHELPELPRHELKESTTQNHQPTSDNTSSAYEWSVVSSVWNKLSNGIMYIIGQNTQPNEPRPPLYEDDIEDSNDSNPGEPLEGCAAVIWPMYHKLIKIIEDPFRDKPMITVSTNH